MNYCETLEYIHSVSNFFCKPGLERISHLCEKLGNPQDYIEYVHVSGTNGKGSFCAMLSNVLMNAGYNVGLYTSPYILKFNERISVNGISISDDELSKITDKVKSVADSMEDKPTEFELITAIAFEYFKEKKCDIVVLECGLGGRFDATNIVKKSILSVITGISIDHTSFLGNTIESIAAEKAGIIKQNGKCLWCGEDLTAKKVIYNESVLKTAEFFTCDKTSLIIKKMDLEGTLFDFDEFENLRIKLLGSFQPINACNVITAVKILNFSGFFIDEDSLKKGLLQTVWPARFEVINKDPLLIADGGHNPEGILAAVESIKKYFNKKVVIITGVMKDKDYNFIAQKISEVSDRVYCITPNNVRALPSDEYANVFTNLGKTAYSCENIKTALLNAMIYSKKYDLPIVSLGSLYMYKELIEEINDENLRKIRVL